MCSSTGPHSDIRMTTGEVPSPPVTLLPRDPGARSRISGINLLGHIPAHSQEARHTDEHNQVDGNNQERMSISIGTGFGKRERVPLIVEQRREVIPKEVVGNGLHKIRQATANIALHNNNNVAYHTLN